MDSQRTVLGLTAAALGIGLVARKCYAAPAAATTEAAEPSTAVAPGARSPQRGAAIRLHRLLLNETWRKCRYRLHSAAFGRHLPTAREPLGTRLGPGHLWSQ